MLKPIALALAVALAVPYSAPARAAGVVYLSCPFTDASGPFPVEVTLYEADGRVVLYRPKNGFTSRLAAVFTPDRVLFSEGDGHYVLSRVDLSIDRTVDVLQRTDRVRCTILATPKRAF